jgi:hypothetical protein
MMAEAEDADLPADISMQAQQFHRLRSERFVPRCANVGRWHLADIAKRVADVRF